MNALGMIRTGDLINHYYGEELDTWSAKPHLMNWLIVISYHFFGYNEFALRFPSAIATVFFFILAYKLIILYRPAYFAFFSCLILISTKGIIGFHVGRTGDTDALLVLFLTGFIYFYLKYLEFEDKKSIYFAALLFGLAFYAKGFAAFLVLPGVVIYLLVIKRFNSVVGSKHTLFAVLLVILIIGSWFYLLIRFGISYANPEYGGGNFMEQMVFYDIISRYFKTDSGIGEGGILYFIPTFDSVFNLWNYVFYVVFIYALIKLFRAKDDVIQYLCKRENHLLLFSVCVAFTTIVVISLSQNKHRWYFAPVLLFLTILTFEGVQQFSERSL